jgi:hypothetical protein
MKNNYLLIVIISIVCLVLGFAGGIFIGMKRGVPLIAKKEQWTIGIYRGKTPFSFDSPLNWINPLFTAEQVSDISAKFVADPFLVHEYKTWYLFFEAYNNDTQQGDLSVATSTNTWTWMYQQVILDEPFHLSYPYVFKWEDTYYLIPESYEDNSIRLYRAEEFPFKWAFITNLVEGRDYVDNSIVHFNNRWWLFASVTSNDTLYLFHAENLTGPWIEHPASPIVTGTIHKARPSGRLIVYDDKLYRYTMDNDPPMGNQQVMAYEITEISTSRYAERIAQTEPILKASGSGWNGQAMHQIDPVQIRPGKWIASVDGFGIYTLFGLEY